MLWNGHWHRPASHGQPGASAASEEKMRPRLMVPVFSAVLGLRAARVERLKPAELDLVRLSQPTFAERPLRTPADRPARTATEVARMVEFDVLGLA